VAPPPFAPPAGPVVTAPLPPPLYVRPCPLSKLLSPACPQHIYIYLFSERFTVPEEYPPLPAFSGGLPNDVVQPPFAPHTSSLYVVVEGAVNVCTFPVCLYFSNYFSEFI